MAKTIDGLLLIALIIGLPAGLWGSLGRGGAREGWRLDARAPGSRPRAP